MELSHFASMVRGHDKQLVQQQAETGRAFSEAVAAIDVRGTQLGKARNELEQIKQLVALLRQQALAPLPHTPSGKIILSHIRDHFPWVYADVREAIKVAWPVLLGALEG